MVNGTLFTNGVGSTCATCDVCARSRVRGLRHEERRVATQIEVKKGDCVSAFPIPPDQAAPAPRPKPADRWARRRPGKRGPCAQRRGAGVRALSVVRVYPCALSYASLPARTVPRVPHRRAAGPPARDAPARSRSPRITRSRACRSVARGGTPHRNTLDALLTHDGSKGIKWVDRENKTKHAKRIPPL